MTAPKHPWENFTQPEPVRPRPEEGRCNPGEPESPDHWCKWHRPHVWCPTCLGYYGVPHDGIHDEDGWQTQHPYQIGVGNCACRVCRTYMATLRARMEAPSC